LASKVISAPVTLGRRFLPIYLAIGCGDPFDTGTQGDIGTLFESLDDKAFGSNMVYYQTPTFGGFRRRLVYFWRKGRKYHNR